MGEVSQYKLGETVMVECNIALRDTSGVGKRGSLARARLELGNAPNHLAIPGTPCSSEG